MFENNRVADSAFGAAMKVVILIIFLPFYVLILLQYMNELDACLMSALRISTVPLQILNLQPVVNLG
jgi:hypothetical protein